MNFPAASYWELDPKRIKFGKKFERGRKTK
jgi:hypothetical protein